MTGDLSAIGRFEHEGGDFSVELEKKDDGTRPTSFLVTIGDKEYSVTYGGNGLPTNPARVGEIFRKVIAQTELLVSQENSKKALLDAHEKEESLTFKADDRTKETFAKASFKVGDEGDNTKLFEDGDDLDTRVKTAFDTYKKRLVDTNIGQSSTSGGHSSIELKPVSTPPRPSTSSPSGAATPHRHSSSSTGAMHGSSSGDDPVGLGSLGTSKPYLNRSRSGASAPRPYHPSAPSSPRGSVSSGPASAPKPHAATPATAPTLPKSAQPSPDIQQTISILKAEAATCDSLATQYNSQLQALEKELAQLDEAHTPDKDRIIKIVDSIHLLREGADNLRKKAEEDSLKATTLSKTLEAAKTDTAKVQPNSSEDPIRQAQLIVYSLREEYRKAFSKRVAAEIRNQDSSTINKAKEDEASALATLTEKYAAFAKLYRADWEDSIRKNLQKNISQANQLISELRKKPLTENSTTIIKKIIALQNQAKQAEDGFTNAFNDWFKGDINHYTAISHEQETEARQEQDSKMAIFLPAMGAYLKVHMDLLTELARYKVALEQETANKEAAVKSDPPKEVSPPAEPAQSPAQLEEYLKKLQKEEQQILQSLRRANSSLKKISSDKTGFGESLKDGKLKDNSGKVITTVEQLIELQQDEIARLESLAAAKQTEVTQATKELEAANAKARADYMASLLAEADAQLKATITGNGSTTAAKPPAPDEDVIDVIITPGAAAAEQRRKNRTTDKPGDAPKS